MATRVVPVTEDEFARAKREIEERSVAAEVTGDQPIRDAVTRESVQPGGTVRLDPKTTMVDHLVRSGAVKLLAAKPAATPEG